MEGQQHQSAVGRDLLSWMSKQETQKPGANCHPVHVGKALEGGPAGQELLTRLCLLSHHQPAQRPTMCWVLCQAPLSIGIFQTRILEWAAVSSSRGSSLPRD